MELDGLPARIAATPGLRRWGRGLDAEWLLEVGGDAWLLTLRDGEVARLRRGLFQMPAFTLALRIAPEGMARFLAAERGWHELMALRRQGALEVLGDTACFFAHLMWFREVFALLRDAPPAPAAPSVPSPELEPITGRYMRLMLEGRPHRLYWEEAGPEDRDAVPLLLLHTAGSDGRQWRALLNDAELTRRFRCIAFDMPWHGKSSPPAGWEREEYRLTTAGYTGLVMAVARALRLDRPVVVGCSIGGRIVLDLAAAHAAELRGVIGLQGSAFTGGYYDLSVLHHPRIHGEVCGAVVAGLVGPGAPDADRWETLWHYMQGGPGVFRGDLHFYAEEGDLRDRLARIDTTRCPVTLLTGEYDYSCRPEDTRATAAAIPGAEAVIMPGLGHFPMSEDFSKLRPYLVDALNSMLGDAP